MLSKVDRKKLIRKTNRRANIAWGLLVLFAIFFFIAIKFLRGISDDPTVLMVLTMFMLSPLFGFIYIAGTNSIWEFKIKRERLLLQLERKHIHFKLFWEAIEAKEYEKAIEMYNTNNFLAQDDKILCEGILIGIGYLCDGDVNNFILSKNKILKADINKKAHSKMTEKLK